MLVWAFGELYSCSHMCNILKRILDIKKWILDRFHGKPPVKPVDLSCNWFKAYREMQYKNRVPHPPPPKQGSGVVKYQCCRTTITNYLVGGSAVDRKVSAGGTEVLPCVRNRVFTEVEMPIHRKSVCN